MSKLYLNKDEIMEKDNIVSMRHISKTYSGVKALKNVDFELKRQEIHCLIGSNGSGKSTLMKILSGVERPDDGAEISINGIQYSCLNRTQALEAGVSIIYQDLSLFPNLTVWENISFIENIDGKLFVDRKKMRATAVEKIQEISESIDPDILVGDLPIAKKQIVAICRALVGKLNVLIMDEPTSSLTAKEVSSLFRIVKKLTAQGTTIVFISHKLDEIKEIADRVTVIKDGERVGELKKGEISKRKITEMMTGRKLAMRKIDTAVVSDKKVLEVAELTRKGEYRHINFFVREGEIVGITGLLGSGRTELAMTLAGFNRPDEGKIYVENNEVKMKGINDGVGNGIAFVPEDRLNMGLVMPRTVQENLLATTLKKQINRLGFLDTEKRASLVKRLILELGIKVPSVEAKMSTLSGGNQQKVVIAKWLATNPKVLLLDGPTVGIDIAAKASIYEIIRKLAAEGMSVIIISDEIEEVLENSHRIFVMHEGQFIGEFQSSVTEEKDIEECINQGVIKDEDK